MTTEEILKQFEETGALLEGHFVLSSGLHSPRYLQCALALQNTADAIKFGRAIARHYTDQRIDTVASPAIGGLIIGFAVALALDARFVWTERQDGRMTLRRGFAVSRSERILVVEDVITTGGSTRGCIAALDPFGAEIVGAASIIDRSDGTATVGVPRLALVTMEVKSYSPAACPMCQAGKSLVKPGSRTIK